VRISELRARLRHALRAGDALGGLTDDELAALSAVARRVGKEHVAARRGALIDPTARISPLASLRFVERVEIGPRATVGPYCCVWGGWSRTWARVEADALLSPHVVLVAGNHGLHGDGPVRDQPFDELDVSVGAGAWVGAHATVVGVRVGAGAVIGAGSVVTSDVPDLAIAVGSPARVIGYRGDKT
jgi:acetyltransferase-like isoleucine patch superfamily enzyme